MKGKKNTELMALIIAMMFTLSIFALPTTIARDPPIDITTFAFINVAPDPVGVGQEVDVIMWVDKTPGGRGAAAAANDIRFHDYKLTITAPDGSTEVKTWDIIYDTTSSQYTSYTPDQIGEYTFTFDFPEQVYTWSGLYQNDTYLASTATTTLTVQEEPITEISSYPLPTEYWTRPIYGENPYWWTISSNWLGTGSPEFRSFNFAYNVAIPGAIGSQTSHIMWTRPLQAGGVVGGSDLLTPGDTFFEGTAYRNRFTNPIIMNGKLYYKEPLNYAGSSSGPTVCIDLHTGELLWSRTDIPFPSFGYIYSFQSMDFHGVMQPMLIATSGRGSPLPQGMWMGFDADTGEWLFNITDVPSGAKAMGPQGEYLQYIIENAGTSETPDYRLLQWNSSKLGTTGRMADGSILGVINATTQHAYDWNVSIPWRNTMSSAPTVVAAYDEDIMLCYSGILPTGDSPSTFGRPISDDPYTYFAVNLNPSKGALGSVLWEKTYNAPSGGITVFISGADPETGVFVESYKETMQWVGYNLRTGERMWGPSGGSTSFDYYGNDFGGSSLVFFADGNFYFSGHAGIVYSYDAMTGNLLWTYGDGGEGNSTSSGAQMAYGRYPTMIEAIGNGVIYTSTIEHTVNTPIYKGAEARAINATDGTEIYAISDFGSSWTQAIADGFTTWMNGYDNQIYCVGRGPTALTVDSPMIGVQQGSSITIRGKVTDIAAGTQQNAQIARFPHGVPAVSDESMSDWMEYVYMQRPKPTEATGVPVNIDVIDSNGNYRNIGTVTSDTNGFFYLKWTPDISGEFKVIATFAGSQAYWPSSDVTAFTVDEVAPTAAATSEQVHLASDMYLLPGILAIIITVIVVGVAIMLMLRRRA
jgi:outer membrane protein assembly factor BamB